MADSTHPYDRPVGGKGDRDIRTNPKKYRDALFWKRSECCDARVYPRDGKLLCLECNKPAKIKDN